MYGISDVEVGQTFNNIKKEIAYPKLSSSILKTGCYTHCL